MAFFENLGKKVGEAAQAAAKKSSEIVEVTKLNISISSEEDKIQKLYAQIGKRLFEEYCSGQEVAEGYKVDCEAIKAHQDNIKGFKEKIMELKNIQPCPNCGNEVEKTAAFCARCGTKIN